MSMRLVCDHSVPVVTEYVNQVVSGRTYDWFSTRTVERIQCINHDDMFKSDLRSKQFITTLKCDGTESTSIRNENL